MTIHKYKCPKCGSTTIALERRINGNAICSDCRHRDVAAINTGRNAILIEREEKYCEIIRARIPCSLLSRADSQD